MLNNYAIIKDVCRKYNIHFPSSAPVERLVSFTTTLNRLTQKCLTDEHFEERVLLEANCYKDSNKIFLLYIISRIVFFSIKLKIKK